MVLCCYMEYPSFGREALSVLFKAGVFLAVAIILIVFIATADETGTISDGTCNVAVLPLEGVIVPFAGFDDYSLSITPAHVRDFINEAESDPAIAGILYEINSPGGTPVAAEQISEYIRSSALPSVSLIGDVGASGGYLVAASADTVLASAMSDVGSIGVTMSYVENSKQNEDDGLTFVELTSGKYKESGNPNKPLTEEERSLFESDLAIIHNEFVRQIAELRGTSSAAIQALADGSSMPGSRALASGLIDAIGGRYAAQQTFAAILGVGVEDIIFCEYDPNA